MGEQFSRSGKLLLRIRSLKWHATTIATSSANVAARQQAIAIVADLETLADAAQAATTSDAIAGGEQRADALARRVSDLGPNQ